MTEIDNYLNERLSHVNTDTIEAMQHNETYSLVNSTNNDAWITADQKDTMEIRQ